MASGVCHAATGAAGPHAGRGGSPRFILRRGIVFAESSIQYELKANARRSSRGIGYFDGEAVLLSRRSWLKLVCIF